MPANGATVIRLPDLYGPGLKKNVVYDLLNDNDVRNIDSRGLFQFYDLVRLWRDVKLAPGLAAFVATEQRGPDFDPNPSRG